MEIKFPCDVHAGQTHCNRTLNEYGLITMNHRVLVLTVTYIRSCLIKQILVQDVGGPGFQTADICRYVEDLKPGPNTQLGPKDFF